MEQHDRWTIEHFSQSSPAGAGQGDVPALLLRVAETMEMMGPIDVQDLVMHNDNGGWRLVQLDGVFSSPN